jgi:hypothetical protein
MDRSLAAALNAARDLGYANGMRVAASGALGKQDIAAAAAQHDGAREEYRQALAAAGLSEDYFYSYGSARPGPPPGDPCATLAGSAPGGGVSSGACPT